MSKAHARVGQKSAETIQSHEDELQGTVGSSHGGMNQTVKGDSGGIGVEK